MVLNMLVKNSLINSYLFYNVLIAGIIKSDTYYHKFIYEKIIKCTYYIIQKINFILCFTFNFI